MFEYKILSGETVALPDEPANVVAFVKSVIALAEQPTITEDALVTIVYSLRNPLLCASAGPGPAAVTKAVHKNPAYHVLLDVLERVRFREHGGNYADVQAHFTLTVAETAAQLGITGDAVRKAIVESRLSGLKINGVYYILPASVASYRVRGRA
jgi:hypothetical protein